MTTKTLDDWLTDGTEVVILISHRHVDEVGTIRGPYKVEKVLKRDIVLDQGDRFSKMKTRTLDGVEVPIRHRGTWDPPALLVPVDHPAVAKMRTANHRRKTKSNVGLAYSDFAQHETVETAEKLRQAIDAWQQAQESA